MKKMLLLCGAMLALTAVAAFAAPGVNIAWTSCAIDGGAANRDFACANNNSPGTLIFSWEPADEVPVFNGAECFVDIYFPSSLGTVPAWWGNNCTGKTVAVGISVSAPTLTNCVDAWAGQGLGALAAYNIPIYIQHGDTNVPGYAYTAQVDAVAALAQGLEQDITPGSEYYLFSINILGSKTTGTGSCAGCNTPAILNAQGVWVTQPAPAPQQEIYTQGTQPTVTILSGTGAVATQGKTWGALKAMYR